MSTTEAKENQAIDNNQSSIKATDPVIVIDLKDSTSARGFKDHNQIHLDDIKEGIKLIGELRDKAKSYKPGIYDSVALVRDYDTIGVFGDRGSGKTSFMVSLLEVCKDNPEYSDLMILRMIDPTLIEQKKPIVLGVLGMINRLVEDKLNNSECSIPDSSTLKRREWEKTMKNLATGIIAIEQVGSEFYKSLWSDEDYVMNTGFNKVDKANDFERYIRQMLTQALSILNKTAFILAFDDIDVNVSKGWEVLECLRRYFSDPRIISIVSGNLKLYGMIARQNLCASLTIDNPQKKALMANELESQYLLKILKPEKRLNLSSLRTLLNQGRKINFKLADKSQSIDDAYSKILEGFGIKDKSTQATFISFLESMSLRSQINFMKESWEGDKNHPSFYVFSSRLYAEGIDMESLRQNPSLTNIVVLNYLTSTKNLPDAYLLLPTLPDKDTNSNFTALTFLESLNFKSKPHLIIDYLLRIGYMRNLILPMTDSKDADEIIKYAGWNQTMSLKNNIGLTIAFAASKSPNPIKDHISLFGLERTAKSTTDKTPNAIDSLLEKHHTELQSLLAVFPFIRIANSTNNNGQNFYSIFALLAVIAEILKCDSEETMIAAINDLKLFRTYLVPAEGEVEANEVELGTEIRTTQDNIKALAHKMHEWKKKCTGAFLPPYAIGRIATRLFNAVLNVAEKKVGDAMNIMVCDFLNACIIEESRVQIEASKQAALNNSNPRTDSKIFQDNLKKDFTGQLKFSLWIMACPMLNCFVDPETYEEIARLITSATETKQEQIKVFELLNQIRTKYSDKKKEDFSGEKTNGWKKTLQILIDDGIEEESIKRNIISADIKSAKEYLEDLDLFKSVPENSLKAFIKAYKAEKMITKPGVLSSIEKPKTEESSTIPSSSSSDDTNAEGSAVESEASEADMDKNPLSTDGQNISGTSNPLF